MCYDFSHANCTCAMIFLTEIAQEMHSQITTLRAPAQCGITLVSEAAVGVHQSVLCRRSWKEEVHIKLQDDQRSSQLGKLGEN